VPPVAPTVSAASITYAKWPALKVLLGKTLPYNQLFEQSCINTEQACFVFATKQAFL